MPQRPRLPAIPPASLRAALPALLLLAACESIPPTGTAGLPTYPTAPAQAIPVVQYPLSLIAGPVGADGRFDSADRRRIAEFLDAYREAARGPLTATVAGPDSRRSERTADALRDLVRKRGVEPGSLALSSRSGDVASLTLTYTGFAAIPPGCRPETATLNTTGNEVSPNHGCATQHNLAAMIANPADLVSPRATDGYDTMRANRVIDLYRQGKATAAQGNGNDTATVSGVAR